MKRRNARGLAAAFVVTVAAGCGETPQEPAHNPPALDGPVGSQIIKQPDGTCMLMIMGNPPFEKPVPCPEDTAAPTSTFATPPATANPDLPAAPKGWNVEKNPDGTCTAYGPDPCNHPGCNPPPPRKVACPADVK